MLKKGILGFIFTAVLMVGLLGGILDTQGGTGGIVGGLLGI